MATWIVAALQLLDKKPVEYPTLIHDLAWIQNLSFIIFDRYKHFGKVHDYKNGSISEAISKYLTEINTFFGAVDIGSLMDICTGPQTVWGQ